MAVLPGARDEHGEHRAGAERAVDVVDVGDPVDLEAPPHPARLQVDVLGTARPEADLAGLAVDLQLEAVAAQAVAHRDPLEVGALELRGVVPPAGGEARAAAASGAASSPAT